MRIGEILFMLRNRKFDLHNEKILQAQMADQLLGFDVQKEYRLDDKNIVDFFVDGGIAIEVKIAGGKKDIYKQCLRYAMFDQVEMIVLVTNKAVGLPKMLNGKPTFIIKLGDAWL